MRRDVHRAFGLRIRTEIPLPELPAAAEDGPVDLDVLRRPAAAPDGPPGAIFSGAGATLRWPAVGTFAVEGGGRTIAVAPTPGVGDDLLAFPLLGPVLACALHLRGRFVLHASAIRVGGAAVALMGDKGAGKSTLACAFLSSGRALLADDLVVADPAGAGHEAAAGFPQLKLDDASLALLDDPLARRRPSAHPAIDKTRVLVGRFAAEPAPLARLYVVARGARAAIAPLAREAALREVLRFAYAARFGAPALGPARAPGHLVRAAALADSGLVARLVVPEGRERLGEAVAAVEDDVGGAGRVARGESAA